MFIGVIVSWPIALFLFLVFTRAGRAIFVILLVLFLWNRATDDSHSETLTCTVWQGIETCQSPDGYVSHSTRWRDMTSHWDNSDQLDRSDKEMNPWTSPSPPR